MKRSAALFAVLLLMAGLYLLPLVRFSPVSVEFGHLAAGVSIWQTGQFEDYPVNPPLVKLVSAAPASAMLDVPTWRRNWLPAKHRSENAVGRQLAQAHPDRWVQFLRSGRLACLPFALLAVGICWKWARELYGPRAGWLAALCLALEPNFMGWSVVVSTDVPASSLGVQAVYQFWRWLRAPGWRRSLALGLLLGLALLTKFTWLILLPMLPCLWLIWNFSPLAGSRMTDGGAAAGGPRVATSLWLQAAQLGTACMTAIYLVNLAYGFEGSFERLASYQFQSRAFAGVQALVDGGSGGNRFAAGNLGAIPVPVPRNYLAGIDLQKVDFEKNRKHYLNGHWEEGRWYFYLEALALKVPLGLWLLGLMAAWRVMGSWRGSKAFCQAGAGTELAALRGRRTWRDELVLLAPAAGVMTLLMANPQVAYLRYALPAFPFACIFLGRVLEGRPSMRLRWAAAGALGWAACSSLGVFPHSLSYFNEIAGGPTGGPRFLLDAETDWGQDLFYLNRWRARHPQATPFYPCVSCTAVPSALLDVEMDDFAGAVDPGFADQSGEARRRWAAGSEGPVPGWFAINVNALYDPNSAYAWFRPRFTPVAKAGYSIWIYNISSAEADRARREFGQTSLEEL